MKPETPISECEDEFKRLLALLVRTGKYLEELKIDPNILNSYQQLLRYLRTRTDQNILEILGKTDSKTTRKDRIQEPLFSDQEILDMPVQKILDFASNKDVSRKDLERIASKRFGVTKGALSTLRSKDALIDKIKTLIGNEATHDSIARVAIQHGQRR